MTMGKEAGKIESRAKIDRKARNRLIFIDFRARIIE
jgi:hypothetical protein